VSGDEEAAVMAALTLHLGELVYDRAGTVVGRIDQVRRADPMAMGDDGRRLGEAGDLATVLPGWYSRRLPHLPRGTAATLVNNGYLRIRGGRLTPTVRYAALTDIADVDEDGVHLRVELVDLPVD
jgi:hypothetical protein